MNILFIGMNFKPEKIGIGKYSGELVDSMRKYGHKVDVITTYPFYPEWKIQKQYAKKIMLYKYEPEVDTVRCPIYVPKKINFLNRLIHYFTFLISIIPILIMKLFKNYDLVYLVVPSIIMMPLLIIFTKIKKIKFIVHVQDIETAAAISMLEIKNLKMIEVISKLERYMYEKVDMVITISENMSSYFMKFSKINRHFLLRNWVETNNYESKYDIKKIREKYNLEEKDFIILYSGSIGWKQGTEILLKTSEKLNELNVCNYKMVISGDGPDKEYLKHISQNNKNILWLPLQEENLFADFMSMADIHLITQKKEMTNYLMPSKLTSIFASGKPVIAQTNGGTELEEMIKNAGVTVKIDECDELVSAILYLKNNDKIRCSYGKNAKAKAYEYYDKQKLLSNLNNKLIEIIK